MSTSALRQHWHLTIVIFLALLGALALGASRAVAEDLGAPGGRLGDAVGVISSSRTSGDLRQVLNDNRITLQFVKMAPGIYARYSVGRKTIDIDEQWIDADAITLAAVVVHEATHAKDAVSGYLASGGAATCIDSEVRAFRASAALWTEIYGPAGKPDPVDDLERQLNLIAERQNRDPESLEGLVRQAYTDQCGR